MIFFDDSSLYVLDYYNNKQSEVTQKSTQSIKNAAITQLLVITSNNLLRTTLCHIMQPIIS
jgi:hypothetical protein